MLRSTYTPWTEAEERADLQARRQAQAMQIFKMQQKQYEQAYMNKLDEYIVSGGDSSVTGAQGWKEGSTSQRQQRLACALGVQPGTAARQRQQRGRVLKSDGFISSIAHILRLHLAFGVVGLVTARGQYRAFAASLTGRAMSKTTGCSWEELTAPLYLNLSGGGGLFCRVGGPVRGGDAQEGPRHGHDRAAVPEHGELRGAGWRG